MAANNNVQSSKKPRGLKVEGELPAIQLPNKIAVVLQSKEL